MKNINLLIMAGGWAALGGYGLVKGGPVPWRAKRSPEEIRNMSRFLIAAAALLFVVFAVSNLN